jgi:hypothetical protein
MNKTRDSHWRNLAKVARLTALNPARFIVQHIAPLLYGWAQKRPGTPPRDRAFNSDEQFWHAAPSLPFSTVELRQFRLLDWFPRAPGVYHSRQAVEVRESRWDRGAVQDPDLGLIVPPGSKMDLIEEGGVGTIRLQPRRIESTDYWLTTAVTDIQCAGGVPVAIPDQLVRPGHFDWGDTVTVRGKVRTLADLGLEDPAKSVHHAAPLLVVAESVDRSLSSEQSSTPILLTPVVLFSDSDQPDQIRNHDWGGEFGYSFVQVPPPGPDHQLDAAEEWLTLYASKHGGKVITNFDQLRPFLADAPLSYQRLVTGTYDRAIIQNLHFVGHKLADQIDRVENVMSVNVTLGDGSVIHGDFVVANSIRDSFNRAKEASGSDELRALLERLSSQVGSMLEKLDAEDAKKTADALETLTKEATREKPRREWWELSLKGLTDAAKSVKEIGRPIIETAGLLIPILTQLST